MLLPLLLLPPLMLSAVSATTSSLEDSGDVPADPSKPICHCNVFIQSEKSSSLIRLQIGSQQSLPVVADSRDDSTCLKMCQHKLPLSDVSYWRGISEEVCKAVVENNHPSNGDSQLKRVRSVVQAYYRAPHHAWKPLGAAYRRIIACPIPRIQKRSVVLKNARKISHQSGFNSIDAQIMVNSDAPTPSKGDTKNQTKLPDEESTKRPVLLDVAPLQMALKRFDVLSPYVDSVFGETDRIDVRDVLDRFRLGGIVDRYHHVYDHFADEMDALRCTCEYLLYTLFNHRLSSGTPAASSSRGLQDDVMNLVVDAAASFLRNDNSSQLIRDVWNLLPARGEIVFPEENDRLKESVQGSDPSESLKPESNPSVPDVKQVALTIGRFYLRHYLANSDSTKSSAIQLDSNSIDPNDNPDNLADMVEQVSRPFFLSIFGVVPGLPASGRLDRRLLDVKHNEDPLENRIKFEPMQDALPYTTPPKTGNIFFDAGNTFFSIFQRANDATHSLFCAKQYMVNKVWERFRFVVRKAMKSIPTMGRTNRM